jgi:hypothetical protein
MLLQYKNFSAERALAYITDGWLLPSTQTDFTFHRMRVNRHGNRSQQPVAILCSLAL